MNLYIIALRIDFNDFDYTFLFAKMQKVYFVENDNFMGPYSSNPTDCMGVRF